MLLLFLALFDGVVLRGHTLYERDLDMLHRPLRALLVRLWHATGGPPPWNPLFDMGQPFAANPQAAVFHPLSWLFLILPWEAAFRAQVLLPLLASFAGMFTLVRMMRGSRTAAVLAAGSWAFGGLLLSLTNLLPMLLTVAPVPAMLAFALRIVRGAGRWDALGFAACVALACAGGEPVTLLAAALLVVAALSGELVSLAGRRRPAAARAALRVAGAGVLGVGMAAAVLLPSLALAARSVRAAGLPLERSEIWSFPPVRLLEFVLPRVMGHTDRGTDAAYWGAAAYPSKKFPLIYSIYPGVLIAALAAAALARPRPARFVWAGAGLLGYLLALGGHAPFWMILRGAAPISAALRYPEKFAVVTCFAATVLAAVGFDDVASGRRRARRWAGAVLVGAAALAAAGGVLAAAAPPAAVAALTNRLGVPAVSAFASLFPRDCALTVALAIGYLLGLKILVRQGRARGGAWLAAVLALDLFVAGKGLVPSRPTGAVDPAFPLLRPLAHSLPPVRLFDLAEWRPTDPVLAAAPSGMLVASWGIGSVFDLDVDLSELAWSGRASRLFWRAANADSRAMTPILLRRGVGAVLARPAGERRDDPARKSVPTLLRLQNPQPDVFCADRVVRFDGDEGWVAAVTALGERQRTAALVEGPDSLTLPGYPGPCRAQIVARNPVRLAVDVVADGPGDSLLAVNQTWDDRWLASVDRVPARLWRTDISLSAVLVPTGTHRVELVYRDRTIERGLAVSGAALLLALAIAGFGGFRRLRT
jgi:hypothetical protein